MFLSMPACFRCAGRIFRERGSSFVLVLVVALREKNNVNENKGCKNASVFVRKGAG